MRKLSSNILLVAMAMFSASSAIAAHHGNAAFDTTKKSIVKGTVTEWFWSNPHCWLKFDVKNEKGSVTHWVAEASNPPDMVNRGWSKQSFKPGDEVTVTMLTAKNGTPVGRIEKVVLPSGLVLSMQVPGDPNPPVTSKF